MEEQEHEYSEEILQQLEVMKITVEQAKARAEARKSKTRQLTISLDSPETKDKYKALKRRKMLTNKLISKIIDEMYEKMLQGDRDELEAMRKIWGPNGTGW